MTIVQRTLGQFATALIFLGCVHTQAESGVAANSLDPRPILLEARGVAQTIKDHNGRTHLLWVIAREQTTAHDPQAALDTLNACSECDHMSALLAPIAGEFAWMGNTEKAQQLAERIRSDKTVIDINPGTPPYVAGEREVTTAWNLIAKAHIKRGDIRGARESLEKIPGHQLPYPEISVAMATQQVKSGDWLGAIETVKNVMGLIWISEAAWQCMLEPVFRASRLESIQTDVAAIKDTQTQMFALAGLAQIQASRNDLIGASQTSETIRPGYARASALKSLAELSIRLGDKRAAAEYLREAAAAARMISGDIARADTLWRISAVQAEAEALNDAIETVRSIEMDFHRDAAIREIAFAQAKTGDRTGALATLSLSTREGHEGAVCNTAFLLSLSGMARDARLLVQEDSGQVTESCALSIADGQLQAGDIVGAQATIASINSPERQAARLQEYSRLTEALKETGDQDEVRKQRNAVVVVVTRLTAFEESLAQAHARAGDLAAALAILNHLPSKEFPIESVAFAMAKSNQTSEALSWARTLAEPKEQSHALLGIAKGLIHNTTSSTPRSLCDGY